MEGEKFLCAAIRYKGNKLGQILAQGDQDVSYPDLYESLIDRVWFESSVNLKFGKVEGIFKWVHNSHREGDFMKEGKWIKYEQNDQEGVN